MDEEDVWLDDMRRVETNFAERTRIAKLAMIRVRKKRKNMALEVDNPAQGWHTHKSRIKFHFATVSIRYGCGHEQGRLSLGLGPCPTGNGEEGLNSG